LRFLRWRHVMDLGFCTIQYILPCVYFTGHRYNYYCFKHLAGFIYYVPIVNLS
jgi:hypothetical protein